MYIKLYFKYFEIYFNLSHLLCNNCTIFISRAHLEKLLEYINTGVKEGAKLIHGGKRVNRPGKHFDWVKRKEQIICEIFSVNDTIRLQNILRIIYVKYRRTFRFYLQQSNLIL